MNLLEQNNFPKPDHEFQLPITKKIDFKHWSQQLEPISSLKTYLYFLYLIHENKTLSIYIGKTQDNKDGRIQQHIDSLKKEFAASVHKKKDTIYYKFYTDIHKYSPSSFSISVYKFSEDRQFDNLFSFPFILNVSNAEAVFISYFSRLYSNVLLNQEFVGTARPKLKDVEIPKDIRTEILGDEPMVLWKSFLKWFISDHTPLFETNPANIIQIKQHKSFKELKKHPKTINKIVLAAQVIHNSYLDYIKKRSLNFTNQMFSDGLIYMIYFLRSDLQKIDPLPPKLVDGLVNVLDECEIIPIYIGKTEMIGTKGGYSDNLKNVHKKQNLGKFARWGYDKARHMGALSLRFYSLPNERVKDYEEWISLMFMSENRSNKYPKLAVPVYFQIKPWFPYNIKIDKSHGYFTPEAETLLIALARSLFPDVLTNKRER